jgi:hypothetical protein
MELTIYLIGYYYPELGRRPLIFLSAWTPPALMSVRCGPVQSVMEDNYVQRLVEWALSWGVGGHRGRRIPLTRDECDPELRSLCPTPLESPRSGDSI